MFERKRGEPGGIRAKRPVVETLEGRQLLVATLAPIGPLQVPASLGFQLPLDGGAAGAQTYTVASDNPSVRASVAQGQFLTVTVSHTSSGANDVSFTGSLVFQLFEDLTPLTASRIEQLVTQGFYTGKNFHRISPGFPGPNDFIVQGGSVNGDGTGEVPQPGFPFADEFVQQLAFTGTGQLAMANSGDDTNSSQFFVTTGMPRFLDFQHTIFAQLVSGTETLALMTQVARNGTTPVSPILIDSATLSAANPDGVVHIDTTSAVAGQSANLTITATETATGLTTSRTVQVGVVADVGPDGTDADTDPDPFNERAFLGPVDNQVVGRNADGTPQTAVFQLFGIDSDGDQLTFDVGQDTGRIATGAVAPIADIPATQGTATVDANGIVRVTPARNFTGVINLVVGVRDQTNRVLDAGGNLNSAGNFDTQRITLTVTGGAVVNLRPIAISGTTTATANTPTTVQLAGDTANPQSSQTLTFSIVTPPTRGTVSNFNPATGTFTYTPNADFTGTDTLTFRVRDVGDPTPNLDSLPALHSIVVGLGATGTVRRIGRVLVVTPAPRTDGGTNTIQIGRNGDNVQVQVNGAIDALQPAESDLDRIVVYGAKASDTITVAQDVTVPTTLDGGHGGVNRLTAGGGASRQHGWFGRNVLRGGPQDDALIGQAGRVRFRPSIGRDILFAGEVRRNHRRRLAGGTYYRFINDRLVETSRPDFPVRHQRIRVPGRPPADDVDAGADLS